jgi:thiol-disulfide isomerase/thioredoxin
MAGGNKCILLENQQELDNALIVNKNAIALVYASWCPFCAKFLPVFKKQAEEGKRFYLLVQDDEENIAGKYAINIFPTVLFFEKGMVANRLDGAPGIGLREEQLVEFIKSCPLPD